MSTGSARRNTGFVERVLPPNPTHRLSGGLAGFPCWLFDPPRPGWADQKRLRDLLRWPTALVSGQNLISQVLRIRHYHLSDPALDLKEAYQMQLIAEPEQDPSALHLD
jgi:hypothetical protein